MKKISETDNETIFDDGDSIIIESKSGGRITTRKHDISWHDNAPPRLKVCPCIFCIQNDPKHKDKE